MTFEEWLKTEHGVNCNHQASMVNKSSVQPYLRNRLWWAFEAGVNSGECDRRLKNALAYCEKNAAALKIRNRKLVREMNKLKKQEKGKPVSEESNHGTDTNQMRLA